MNFIKKNMSALAFTLFVVAFPVVSFADTHVVIDSQTKLVNPITKADTINGLIKVLLEGVLKIGMPIVALAVIYCGFLFVQARGKPEAITKAKDALLYTLIGAAILLGSWAIAQLISDTVLELSILPTNLL